MQGHKYEFSVDTAAFPFMIEFQEFSKRLKLGTQVHIEVQKGIWEKPILLKMDIPYDNPDSFNIVFSDKLRFGDSESYIKDLLNTASKISNNVSINGMSWNHAANKSNDITNYMTGALELVNQEIFSKNQEITIDEFGITAKTLLANGSYSPEQMKITGNRIAMTKNNWQTTEAVLGKIKNPVGGGESYGIIAPAIVGNLIAGNQMIISNDNNSFRVDAGGMSAYNANLEMLRKDNKARIYLSPNEGIKIQTNPSGSRWLDSFYVDLNGKIIANDIVTNRGTIGGWRIEPNGLFSPFGDYLRNDGYFKFSLMTGTPYSATFYGNIYAKNLLDKVQTPHIEYNAVDSGRLDTGAVTTPKIRDGAVTENKLDKLFVKSLYADYAEIKELVAKKANIEDLTTATARIKKLEANSITTNNLSAKISEMNFVQMQTAHISSLYIGGRAFRPRSVMIDGVPYTLLVNTSN